MAFSRDEYPLSLAVTWPKLAGCPTRMEQESEFLGRYIGHCGLKNLWKLVADMGVSINGGTPKSSSFIVFSLTRSILGYPLLLQPSYLPNYLLNVGSSICWIRWFFPGRKKVADGRVTSRILWDRMDLRFANDWLFPFVPFKESEMM